MLNNDIESVKLWVKEHDVDFKDQDGKTVLHYACQTENIKPEIVQYLLKKSQLMQTGKACAEFVNVFMEEGNRAALKRLLEASCFIDHRVLTLVLSHGLTHNYPQHFYNEIFKKLDKSRGETQLSDVKESYALRKFIEKNFEKYNKYHKSLLLLKACTEENTTLEDIKSLIKNKADVNFQGEKDETPLHAACKQKDINPAIIKLLVNSGADIEMEDSRYRTPFFLVCDEHAENSGPDELKNIIQLFIDLKSDINARDEAGVTPLGLFADWGDRCLEVTKFLFENGAGLNIEDEEGKTPLQSALDYPTEKNVETIKFLQSKAQSTQTDEKKINENNQINNFKNSKPHNFLFFLKDVSEEHKRKFDEFNNDNFNGRNVKVKETPPSPILQSPSNGYY